VARRRLTKPTAAAPAPAPTPGATTPKSTPPARAVTAEDRNAPLGSAANPLKVSLVSFHGYAPALVANGNDLNTQPGSIYAKEGVNVRFVIQDDIPTLATIFESGAAQCAWRTSDFWAQEQPNLRNAGLDGKAVMIVDNTQGGDAVIARDAAVKAVEELAGRSVALLQFTPSHGMLIDAIDNSSLTARKKESIKMVFINAEEGHRRRARGARIRRCRRGRAVGSGSGTRSAQCQGSACRLFDQDGNQPDL
jgi:NitT/TauT family transport system substrate-binding protein